MTKIMEKPILSFIIVCVVAILVTNILNGILESVFKIFAPVLATHLSMIVTSFIIAFLYVYVFKIKNFLSFSNFKLAFILLCPLAIIFLSNVLDPNFAIPTTGIALINVIIFGLAAGIFEEIVFRGIIVSYLMKFFRDSKYILYIVIGSALIFGIIHVFNVFMGAPLDISIFQAFYAFAMGVIVAAAYLRTGNIWVPIIFHSANDILAFCCTSVNTKGIMQVGFTFDLLNAIIIFASVIFIVLGLYYVRSAKHDDILKVWDEKWAN